MKKKYFKFVIMIIVILISTITIYFVSKIGKSPENVTAENLSTMKIDCSEKIYINGTVQTLQSKNIYLDQVNGGVDSVLVKDGQPVTAGDILFKYKNKDIQSQISELKGQLTTLNNQKARLETKKSYSTNTLVSKKNDLSNLQSKENSDSDIATVKAEINELNSQISSIDDQIATINDSITETNNKINSLQNKENLSVTADVSGTVSIVGSIDDYTKAYMRIDSNDICVKGTVTEKYIKKLQVNQQVYANIISDQKTIKGKISEIGKQPVVAESSNASSQTGSSSLSNYSVTIVLDSTEGLMDGFHVQSYVELIDNKIIINKKSIVFKNNSDYVFKVVKGKLQKVNVTVENSDEGSDKVIIRSGLEDGDIIVTNPSKSMKEGMKIE